MSRSNESVVGSVTESSPSDTTITPLSFQKGTKGKPTNDGDGILRGHRQGQQQNPPDLSTNTQSGHASATTINLTPAQFNSLYPESQLNYWIADYQRHEHLAYLLGQPVESYPYADSTSAAQGQEYDFDVDISLEGSEELADYGPYQWSGERGAEWSTGRGDGASDRRGKKCSEISKHRSQRERK